jgi:hypothetical protein
MTTTEQTNHRAERCDHCGSEISADRLARYDHSHNHDCAMDGHYCSVSCYDTDSGWGSYR